MSMKCHMRGNLNREQRDQILNIAKKQSGDALLQEIGRNMDAMILYTLAEDFGFTREQVRKFHLLYIMNAKFLGMKYAMEDAPSVVAEHFVKDWHVDLEGWQLSDLNLWDKLPNKEEWVMRPLEEFNEYICELANKVIKKQGEVKDADIHTCKTDVEEFMDD